MPGDLALLEAPDDDIFIEQIEVAGPLRACCLLRAGMVNEANMCYANSLLACLACTALYHAGLIDILPPALAQALRALLAREDALPPVHLVANHSALFRGWEVGAHEDAFEFFQHILGDISVEPMRHSIQVTRWHISGQVAVEQQRQHVVPKNEGLQQLSLTAMFAAWGSLLSEEGDWQRSQCALVTAPEIVVLHLQRFALSRGSVTKNNRAVILEDVTELALASGEHVRHRLLALLAHHGSSAFAGHYTAYVRDNGDDAGFLHCDDMRVSSRRIGVAELVEAVSCEAYMLFLQPS